ncbi:MAG: SDR family oxidoreductase [Gammaproteobacteria bacterium]
MTTCHAEIQLPMRFLIPATLAATLITAATLPVTAGADTADSAATGVASKPTVLITGANRGIGLELVRQYSARDWHIIATARNPATATALKALADQDPDISIEKLDVTDHPGIDQLAENLKDQPIDVLLSNAAKTPRYMSAMRGIKTMDYDEARHSFEVNALGPAKLIAAFMPNVGNSAQKKIAVISSKAGSFAEGPELPMFYEYRVSKVALNMIVYTVSFETAKKGITIAAISPGSVDTKPVKGELGFGTDFKQPNTIPPAESVAGLIKVIDNLTPAQNGLFLDYKDGRVIGR